MVGGNNLPFLSVFSRIYVLWGSILMVGGNNLPFLSVFSRISVLSRVDVLWGSDLDGGWK